MKKPPGGRLYSLSRVIGITDWRSFLRPPLIRRSLERDSGDEAVPDFEVVEGRFGLLPPFAKDLRYIAQYRIYNARTKTVAQLRTFKTPWAMARHCIVPCEAIYEPDWRTGEHVATRFTAGDDDMLGVAGIWTPWNSLVTLEVGLSFAMLTVNADDHSMSKLVHKSAPRAAWHHPPCG